MQGFTGAHGQPGGSAGIALGRGTSLAVALLLQSPTIPSLMAVAIAVATSFAVGIVYGYNPAWKAARLDAIEALHHD